MKPGYFRLKQRDLRVLHYLLENRFATGCRLGRLFWKDAWSNTHPRRLRQLRQEGYLEIIPAPGRQSHYRLSEKALSVLKARGFAISDFEGVRSVKLENLRHDSLLQDVREIIEGS